MNNYCEICNKNKGNIYYYHKQIGYEFRSFKRYNQEIGTYSSISTNCIVCDDCIKEFKFKSIGFSIIMIVLGIISGTIGHFILIDSGLLIDNGLLRSLEVVGGILTLASLFIVPFYIYMIYLMFFKSKNNIGDHVAGAYRTGHKMIPLFLYYGTLPSYKTRKDFEALREKNMKIK